MTAYTHQLYIIGTIPSLTTAIQALDAIYPRDDGKPRTPEGVRLSASGASPATHLAAFALLKESQRAALEAAGLNAVPGIFYWRCSNPGGILQSTNHTASQEYAGEGWTFSDCCQALGLSEIPNNAV